MPDTPDITALADRLLGLASYADGPAAMDGTKWYSAKDLAAVPMPAGRDFIAACSPDAITTLCEAVKALKAECDALRADAERYRWLCENSDDDGGLFIGTGRNGYFGECGHRACHHKETADAAIDTARNKNGGANG